jgi:hypothetical protein
MFEAEQGSATKCVQIFDRFGKASGLKVNYTETTVVLIAADTVPAEMIPFNWKWETAEDYSRLLGFCFGDGISQKEVLAKIKCKLAEQIKKAKEVPSTPGERVTVINQLFFGRYGTTWHFRKGQKLSSMH